jgi:hypothetical protein
MNATSHTKSRCSLVRKPAFLIPVLREELSIPRGLGCTSLKISFGRNRWFFEGIGIVN